MAGQPEQLALDTRIPGAPVPLASAGWGAHGTVTGWDATGHPTTHTGWIIRPARLYTGGLGEHRTRRGEQLLKFGVELSDGTLSGCQASMYALPHAQLQPQPAPRPAPRTPMSLADRLPAADLARRDVIWIWDEPGRPHLHVQAAPVPAGGGVVELTVLTAGRVHHRLIHGDVWVDVQDPRLCPWRCAEQPASPRPAAV